MTLAQVLASVDRDSRDALVEDVEDALRGHTAGEVFLVCAYFTALAIARMPCDCNALLEDMPSILRSVIASELHEVLRQ
jgi:hypothetical protein